MHCWVESRGCVASIVNAEAEIVSFPKERNKAVPWLDRYTCLYEKSTKSSRTKIEHAKNGPRTSKPNSYFTPGATKAEVYEQLLLSTEGLLSGQRNWVSARSTKKNTADPNTNLPVTYPTSPPSSGTPTRPYPPPSSSVNWAGFYIRDDKFPVLASPVSSPPLPGAPGAGGVIISTTYASSENQLLLLGPFQGKPACQEIRFGKGVCGTAAAKGETVLVDDVEKFPGHIACDAESKSEIVVPILTVAIIDVDCAETSGFDEEDKKYLEKLAGLLAESCDW
ncbi:uncharacterized protein N7515_008293 [Penicillium bovifimosum]|uniref:GAF domain-containing protein n=1 Tax=Penicillium bovifimosum TaxID=126998 RepID=A0A9W9GMZ8_9EURO|nr:uncharacterized protein N7515_008293 [Penicillium bovifimosum]KAJ5124468.1 hypothetical protein N7515_008293 [Penicillium bovifimosum]